MLFRLSSLRTFLSLEASAVLMASFCLSAFSCDLLIAILALVKSLFIFLIRASSKLVFEKLLPSKVFLRLIAAALVMVTPATSISVVAFASRIAASSLLYLLMRSLIL